MAGLSVQDLVKSCGVQEALLDGEVTYECFYEISRCLSEWKLAALKLNISQAEVDAIERENGKAELQRVNFLGVWRQKMTFKATYRVLVEALLSIGRAEDARGVCRTVLDFNPTPPALPPTVDTVSPSAATPSGCATSSSSPATLAVAPTESSLPLSSQSLRTAEDIARMEKDFDNLLDKTEKSFLNNEVSVIDIKRSIKCIPLTLKTLLGDCFRNQAASFWKSEGIEELFFQLSYFWDYLNPELLCFFIKKFGSSNLDLKASKDKYLQELDRFRKGMKICEFIAAASCAEANELRVSFYSHIVTVMDDTWNERTLQDVEEYRKEFCNDCRFPQSFFTKVRIQRSSIAIVFYFPRKSELNIEELKPIFKRRNVVKVLLENICIIDWTKEVPSSSDCSMSPLCTLCHEKINAADQTLTERHDSLSDLTTKKPPSPQTSPKPQRSRKSSWLSFGKKQPRLQESDFHSKVCSSSNPSPPTATRGSRARSGSPSVSNQTKVTDSKKPVGKGPNEEFLLVNVTRSSHGVTDVAPFKIVTKTNLPTFPAPYMEVHRSQGDFQWLYTALQEACPERIVPSLHPPILLDATISEFQRFLSRVSSHKALSTHHYFVVFISGTEELGALRAKHRPTRHGEQQVHYKPAVGRDTNSGPLLDTKDYLTMLEQNLVGLTSHLEQSTRRGRGSPMERMAHWFRAISNSEPHHTYLKRASADLARTCENIDGQIADSDEMLFVQNLQSLTDYIRVAQDLLIRVEEAVDQYLYWDEEVTIIEAANSSPKLERSPAPMCEDTPTSLHDSMYGDSGVSDVTSSSSSPVAGGAGEGDHTPSSSHLTSLEEAGSAVVVEREHELDGSTSERWAHARKKCADAKDYLEMMCHDLAGELSLFDLQKEKELKQIFLDYASSQLERHEKFQGKWFAMKFILDSGIQSDKRAIQFNPIL